MNSLPTGSPETPSSDDALLSRGDFLRTLGLSSAGLMALYCMGTLSSCKGSDPAPAVVTPGTGTGVAGNASTSAGAINFTVDLTNSAFSRLPTAGSFVNVGDVIVFNAAGTYRALGRICTHQAGNLSYRSSTNDLVCDVHGGLFNVNGTVKQAPPTVAVKAYTVVQSGNSLTVTA